MNIPDILAVNRKSNNAQDAGVLSLLKGEEKPFTGFPEALKARFNVSLLPTPESSKQLERLMGDIMDKAILGNDVDVFAAVTDYPFHITLLEANSPTVKDFTQVTSVEFPKLDPAQLKMKLIGLQIALSELVFEGFVFTLRAAFVPPEILNGRENLKGQYEGFGLNPLPMDHILHATGGRLKGLPTDSRLKYLQAMLEMRLVLRQTPVIFEVGELHIGPSWDLVHGIQRAEA